MSLEMKKQLLQELMDVMDSHMMSRFKKPGQEESIGAEMPKSEEMPAYVGDKPVEDDDQIDPEMLN